jgi:hypothetical protein
MFRWDLWTISWNRTKDDAKDVLSDFMSVVFSIGAFFREHPLVSFCSLLIILIMIAG